MDPLIIQYPGIATCISNANHDRVTKRDKSPWKTFQNGYAGMHGKLIKEMFYWKTNQNGYAEM